MLSHTAPVRQRGDRSARFDLALNAPGAILTSTLILFSLGLVILLSLRVNDGAILAPHFTLENLASAIADPLYKTVIARSLVIAALVTVATLVTAYPVAYAIAFHGGRHRALLLFVVSLPFWTSYLLRVFAWKIVLAYNGVLNSTLIETGLIKTPLLVLLNTPTAVVVTLAHAYAAFAILPIYVALESIPPSLFEAAADLGARGSDTFRRVTLPLSMPGVLAAALVVFVPTVGDYVTPALVGGPASTMIGTIIQAQFGKANDWPFGAAVSLVTMLAITAVLFTVRTVDRRWGSGT
jgi:spermidine/putrescine transport system permease protein